MSKTLQTLILVVALFGLMALTACTREITTVQQVDPGASNCFNCHTDDPATDQYGLVNKQMEWSYSGHGIGAYVGYAGGRNGCSGCHSGAGFVARLDGETAVPYATTIGCWNCHAPHSNGDFALRVTTAQPLASGQSMDMGISNICTACHVGRTDATVACAPDTNGVAHITSTHWGAHHGPQGDLFYGYNGYEYDGVTYNRAVPASHNTDEARCFGCHGAANATADLGGHSFVMVNGAGAHNVAACNNCHSGLTDFDVNGVQTETEELLAELHAILEPLGLLDSAGHPLVSSGTPDEVGAAWNYIMVEEDRSLGVHNPEYVHDLLQASIDALSVPVK
ncbi:MAG TPA: hypothetical protein PLQ13_04160 [Candidatus Krumholzibacteria bacterium]|nr:hypothetical protein [Candidatus Krumholzibacteria bacterium]